MSSSIKKQISQQFKNGGMSIKLLYINLGVYIIFSIIWIINRLLKLDPASYYYLQDIFSFNSEIISSLIKPWTFITYSFIHGNIMHLFTNMLVLFFAGKMLEGFLGKKRVLSTYMIGALAGAIFYLISHNIFPLLLERGNIPMIGASASVFAILTALAVYVPNYEVFLFGVFKVKLKYLAAIWIGLDVLNIASNDGVAHFAHLGGAIWGFIFISNLRRGKDLSLWFDKIVSFLVQLFTPKKKIKIVWNKKQKTSHRSKPPRDDYDYNASKKERQDKVDEILDKIKESGYDSLSKAEKDYLFDASKKI